MSKLKATSKLSMGGEPDASRIVAGDSSYRTALIQAFNWYNGEKDNKDAVKYLIEWVKKNDKKYLVVLTETDQSIPSTFGWLARLATNGAVLGDDEKSKLHKLLSSLQPKQKTQPKATVATRSVQDAVKEKAQTLLGELEAAFDDIKTNNSFSLKTWLTKNEVPAVYMPFIRAWLQRKMAEYVTVYKAFTFKKEQLQKENLEQIKEGYSNFTPAQVKAFLTFFKQSLEDIDAHEAIKKANRKPRVKKQIAPGVQVKNLKYLKKFDELKLESVSPVDIIGAQQLWVYNTKYRKLGVYKSDTHQGLSVRGTTIQGYVPEESIQKTLRKPESVLKSVLEGGKIVLRRALDNVNAKPAALNGRINEEIILLRVVR